MSSNCSVCTSRGVVSGFDKAVNMTTGLAGADTLTFSQLTHAAAAAWRGLLG